MSNHSVLPVDHADAGFRPSESLRQTSWTRVRVAPLRTNLVVLPNAALGDAPDGYQVHETLVIDNHTDYHVEWMVWRAGDAEPSHWAGETIKPRHSARITPSPLTQTGAALLLRSDSHANVIVRRGFAITLAA